MTSLRLSVLLALAACGGGGGFPPDAGPDAPTPGGRFQLAWSVTDTAAAPIACGQVGAQVVTIALRNLSAAGGLTEAFTCNSGMGTSSPIPPGFYELRFSLNGLAGELATAPSQINVEIKANETTVVTPVTFAVDATGGLELLLAANQTTSNCGQPAAMGAGITALTLALEHTDGSCEPVTFNVSAGATQGAFSYTVDCANPPLSVCIENDQKLTVGSLPSGNYRMRVRGQVNGTLCWTNDDTLVVPPLSKVLKTTLNLAKQNGC